MMYRGTKRFSSETFAAATTPRAPGNVPFLVDNVWEWLRPASFPSRRFSAFAAPSIEGAAASAACNTDQVYRVELVDGQPVCQLVNGERPEDARYHADIESLKRLIIRKLPREWYQLPSSERGIEAVLFLPCATRDDIDMVMQKSTLIDANSIRDACSFWRDVMLLDVGLTFQAMHVSGEIFFEGRYRLVCEHAPS
jgi:hypothetical protein